MKLSSLCLLSLVLCLPLTPAHGLRLGETISTDLSGMADHAKGRELADQVNAAWVLARTKKLAEAESAAASLQKQFEAAFDTRLRQYSFQTADDHQAFKATAQQPFEWIDWSYKECLQIRAYVAAERRDFPLALALLAAIEAVAPMSAGTLTERGYILNQQSKPEEAMAAYKRALELATRYPSQQRFQALSLRGLGFALIELKRLDEAEATFQESLKVDPNNRLALDELAYIRQLRSKGAGAL